MKNFLVSFIFLIFVCFKDNLTFVNSLSNKNYAKKTVQTEDSNENNNQSQNSTDSENNQTDSSAINVKVSKDVVFKDSQSTGYLNSISTLHDIAKINSVLDPITYGENYMNLGYSISESERVKRLNLKLFRFQFHKLIRL